MTLDACLPDELRGPDTTFTKVAAGLSGAGVYRVDARGRSFVLKVSGDREPADAWHRALVVRRHAADAGVAPRVIHVDESRRAVLSDFVVDQSFPRYYRDPARHEQALAQLGETVRRVHGLPLPAGAEWTDPRALLATARDGIPASHPLPAFASEAMARVLAEEAPARERAVVMSHNDLNPSNLVYDGERLLLLDWDTAGPNDPYYDLAVLAVFLRMDEGTCLRLLSAYDGAPVRALPAAFTHSRRVAAVMCGAIFMQLAHGIGHAGATGEETLETTPTLAEFYQRMMAGQVSLASGEGKWAMGLSLIKEGMTSGAVA